MLHTSIDIFHHIVGKLLYVSKRTRIDVDLAVSFLCTRVARSNQQDWDKLRRLLTYLKNTLGLPRVIGAHRLDVLFTWVGASFATHMDIRGHTGGVISFGTGAVSHKYGKSKINTKSSTETELVGVSEYIPWTLWTQRFMSKQGYPIKVSIFYQDNKSVMEMEMNGQRFCSDRSRHIHIKYFFVKDIIHQQNITIEHCGTNDMIADYFTKPLQGSLFIKMRAILMGLFHSAIEERKQLPKFQ